MNLEAACDVVPDDELLAGRAYSGLGHRLSRWRQSNPMTEFLDNEQASSYILHEFKESVMKRINVEYKPLKWLPGK
jgi:hypothetical protein